MNGRHAVLLLAGVNSFLIPLHAPHQDLCMINIIGVSLWIVNMKLFDAEHYKKKKIIKSHQLNNCGIPRGNQTYYRAVRRDNIIADQKNFLTSFIFTKRLQNLLVKMM